MGSVPNRKQSHQHRESKKWVRLPANQRCLECCELSLPSHFFLIRAAFKVARLVLGVKELLGPVSRLQYDPKIDI